MRRLLQIFLGLLAIGAVQSAGALDCPMPKSVERQRAAVAGVLDSGGAIVVGSIDGAVVIDAADDADFISALVRLKADRVLSRGDPHKIFDRDGYVYVKMGVYWPGKGRSALFGEGSLARLQQTGKTDVFPLRGPTSESRFLGQLFVTLESDSCLSMTINEQYLGTGGFEGLAGATWTSVPETFARPKTVP